MHRSTPHIHRRLAIGLAGLTLLLPGSAAMAQTTETFDATVTVTSSLVISEDTPLHFGSLVVVQDGTNPPGGVLGADSSWTTNTATGTENLVQIGSPTAGAYSVDAGVASFVNVSVTFPASATLTNSSAPPGNGAFTADTFTLGTLTSGDFAGTTATVTACNTAIAGGGTCQFVTASTGVLTFPMGASLDAASATASYADGSYSGSFDLTAAFY